MELPRETAQEKILTTFGFNSKGDVGSALGAALVEWHQHQEQERVVNTNDSTKGTCTEFSNDEITNYLEQIMCHSNPWWSWVIRVSSRGTWESSWIGWFNSPMEFGPRALGGAPLGIHESEDAKRWTSKLSTERVSVPLLHRSWKKMSAIIGDDCRVPICF